MKSIPGNDFLNVCKYVRRSKLLYTSRISSFKTSISGVPSRCTIDTILVISPMVWLFNSIPRLNVAICSSYSSLLTSLIRNVQDLTLEPYIRIIVQIGVLIESVSSLSISVNSEHTQPHIPADSSLILKKENFHLG